MKKMVALLGIILLGVMLVGCEEGPVEITPPTLTSFKIDEMAATSGSELVTFYRGKNDTLEVDIVINNPSNLPITSIVINGYNYRDTYFKEGSNTRRVIFDLDVGTTTGSTVFSIDEIKYANGENTERSLIEETLEFHVYVYKDVPTIERKGISTGQNYITLGFELHDIDDVINVGTLRAELYNGEDPGEVIFITDEMESVTFNNLLSQSTYEIRFVADYDLDNNEGMKTGVILSTEELSTKQKLIPTATISLPQVTESSVSFEVTYDDENGVILEGGVVVHIFDGETSIASKEIVSPFQNVTFDNTDGILNNKSYTVKVIAAYDLQDGSGVKEGNILATAEFDTPHKDKPDPTIVNLNVEENRVSFDVEVNDPENFLIPNSLEARIEINNVVIDTSPIVNNHVDFQIFNLFANETFDIIISGTYNLNDGNGEISEDLNDWTYTTNENEAPVVNVSNAELRQGYVTLDLTVVDDFDTLKGDIKAVLKEDGIIVGDPILFGKDAIQIEFEHLVTYTSVYSIEITANYNLRDGNGTHTDQLLFSNVIVTVEKKEPVAELKEIVVDSDSVSFKVRVLDADDTIQPNSTQVYLYKDGVIDTNHSPQTIILDNENTIYTFDDLLSNHDYKLIVKSVYDLDDGTTEFVLQNIYEEGFKTTEKTLPTASLNNVESDHESITVDVTINDEDVIIVPGTMYVVLYKDGIEEDRVQLVSLITPNVTFGVLPSDPLPSDKAFTLRIIVDYDLNDGNDPLEDVTLVEDSISTVAKDAPTAIVDVISETNDEIVLDIEVFDDDAVIDGKAKVELYIGEVLQQTITDLNVGLNTNVTFSGVQSDSRFVIKVVATYNLDDEKGTFTDEVLSNKPASTYEKVAPTAEIIGYVIGKDIITFDVLVTDVDGTVDVLPVNTLVAELYLAGDMSGAPLASKDLSVGNNTGVFFDNLDSNNIYTIVIRTTYDLKDGSPQFTGEELTRFTASTEELDVPVATVTTTSILNTEITFSIDITDLDNTIALDATINGKLFADLYVNGVSQGRIEAVNLGNTSITYDALEYGKEYELKVFAAYDLQDGNGEGAVTEIGSGTASTVNVINITNFNEEIHNDSVPPLTDFSQIYISFNIDVVDTFGILDDPNLIFNLYKADGTQVGTSTNVYTSYEMELLNLQFGKDYYFTITGTVDLGTGPNQHVIYRHDFTTISSTPPSVILSDVTLDQQQVALSISVDDAFGTLRGLMEAKLYEGNSVIPVGTVFFDASDSEIVFDYKASFNNEYRVEIKASYNLGDGEGEVGPDLIFSRVIITVEKKEPSVLITNITPTHNSLLFDLELLDIDGTVTPNSVWVTLYDLDDNPVGTLQYTSGVLPFGYNALTAAKEYKVVVTADYDLSDGSGEQLGLVIYTQNISTREATVPTASIGNQVIGKNDISVDITLTDPDDILTDGTMIAYAYKDGILLDQKDIVVGTFTYQFNNLKTDSDIVILVEASYNMNVGAADVDDELTTETYHTLINTTPTAVIESPAAGKESITVDITLTDLDSVLILVPETQAYAYAYQNGVLKDTEELTLGTHPYSFDGLNSNSETVIIVKVSYNLDDGTADVLGEEITSSTIDTLENEPLDVVFENIVIGSRTIQVDVTVTDTDVVIEDEAATLRGYAYKDGVLLDTQIITVSTQTVTFNVDANSDIEIVIRGSYDLRDGAGTITSEDLYTETYTTDPATSVDASITLVEAKNRSIDVTIDVTDVDGLIVSDLRAVIYDGTTPIQTEVVTIGSNPYTFDGLEYGKSYEIKLLATHNLREGGLDVTDFLLDSETINTLSLVTIDGFNDWKQNSVSTIAKDPAIVNVDFGISVDDVKGILQSNDLVVKLYLADDFVLGNEKGITTVSQISADVTFFNLLFSTDYVYTITASVDHQGGAGTNDEVVYTGTFTTQDIVTPTTTINDLNPSALSIEFTLDDIVDEDTVITGAIEVVLIADGVESAPQIINLTGNGTISFAVDATDGTEYEIVVRTTMDFRDGNGDQTGQIITTKAFIYAS